MSTLAQYLRAPQHLAAAIAIISAAALAAAYIAEYGFDLQPCILCLYQRVPYSLNIGFGALALITTLRYPRLASFLLVFSALIFFAGAAIAGFHVGVEQHWWQGLASCGGDVLPENASIEELRKAITEQPVIRCDTPAWTLFGISMAGYNFILSLALGIAVIKLLRGPHGRT
jgi:disulfide bond formation protein DsbB